MKNSNKKVRCPKCFGTNFYSGRFQQHACEVCSNGTITKEELHNYRINLRSALKGDGNGFVNNGQILWYLLKYKGLRGPSK